MKTNFGLLVLSLFLVFTGCSSNAVDLKNKRVVFIGDSITHGGRYVSYIEYYLQKNNPENMYDIISVGLGSETVSGLSEKDHPFPRPCVHTRLENILKETKPEILFACYGMNDGIYHPQSPERFKAYKDGYADLIDKAKAHGVKQIVLLTPPPYDSVPIRKKTIEKGEFGYKTPYVNYNDVLSDYAKYLLSMDVAGVSVVDLNSTLVSYVNEKRKTDPQFTLSRDGIHPGNEGHLLMAQTVLKGIGCEFNFIPPSEVGQIDKDSFFALVNKKRSKRSNAWLNYIGYTRGKVVKTDSVTKTEEEVKDLQKQIDKLRKK